MFFCVTGESRVKELISVMAGESRPQSESHEEKACRFCREWWLWASHRGGDYLSEYDRGEK
jgi:hypothetical protein